MNFPVGLVVAKGKAPFDILSQAQQLNAKSFDGYLVLSVRGHFVEEGVLFFRNGEMNACVVECLAVDRIVKGNEALSFFANQTKGIGFYQLVELSRSQVDLITAFDEKLLMDKIPLKDLPKFIPAVFSPKFEAQKGTVSALDVYGLGELK